jgi:hypothetical protein
VVTVAKATPRAARIKQPSILQRSCSPRRLACARAPHLPCAYVRQVWSSSVESGRPSSAGSGVRATAAAMMHERRQAAQHARVCAAQLGTVASCGLISTSTRCPMLLLLGVSHVGRRQVRRCGDRGAGVRVFDRAAHSLNRHNVSISISGGIEAGHLEISWCAARRKERLDSLSSGSAYSKAIGTRSPRSS